MAMLLEEAVPGDTKSPDDSRDASLAAPTVTRAEWRWLAVFTAAVLILVEIPYLLAFAQSSRGLVFTGALWWPHDFAQYAAAMREGAASSSWLVHDHLTSEPHDPALIYTFYVGLGKLARLVGADFQIAYHVSEVISRAILLVSMYLLANAILPSVRLRRLALIATVFASGLALWVYLLDSAIPFLSASGHSDWFLADLNVADVSTFITLFTAPHRVLGLALLLLCARSYILTWSAVGQKGAIAVGLCVLGIGLINPYSLPTLCVAVALHCVFSWWLDRRLHQWAVLSAILIFLLSAPFLGYSLVVFGNDPFWRNAYGLQNTLSSSPREPSAYLVFGLSFILALAAVGVRPFLRKPLAARWVVVVWIVVSIALLFAPVSFSRRFTSGLQPMLGIIAAVGLDSTWRWAGSHHRLWPPLARPLLRFCLLVCVFASAAIVYISVLGIAIFPGRGMAEGYYQPAAAKEGAQWLASVVGPEDVILAETTTSNYISGVVAGRVFVGHWSATLAFEDKQRAMREFYGGQVDEHDRQQFLARNRIHYVWYGPRERTLGAVPLEGNVLRLVHRVGDVSIFEVETDGRVPD